MEDFERLSRGTYQADSARKASDQEMAELSRGSYHADALSKAAEQERAERFQQDTDIHQAMPAQNARPGHDVADHTVIRRTTPVESGQAGSGGAVVSKRGRVSTVLRSKMRETGSGEGRARKRAERAARRPRQRRGTRSGRLLRNLLIIAAVLVGLYMLVCGPIDKAISFKPKEREGLNKELSWHVPGMPYYALLLGSDAREGETTSRTDTMVLVRVDNIGGKLTMLSIPRDTMVQIPGQGTQKINAAYAFGGLAGAAHAVNGLTGVPISQVVLIRFDGVEALVDAVGGITVDIPVPVYDPDYTGLIMDPGPTEMDGEEALLFSRVRHGFADGDYQRQVDQRLVMEAVMKKALTMNPAQIGKVAQGLSGMFGTTMHCYNIAPILLRLKLGGTIYQATVPSEPQMIGGVSYVVADEAALAKMMDVIDRGEDPAKLVTE